jgi:hypothetical protein
MATDSRECVATFDHISRRLVEGGEDDCGYPENHTVHEHGRYGREIDHEPGVACHKYQPPEDSDASV